MRRAHSYAPLAVLLLTVVTTAFADVDAITITRAAGTVKVFVSGAPVTARVGTQLGLPARIETGADGSLRIEQASSNLDIGPSSVVVLPERTAGGNTEKTMQNLGRVLYSVKPRKTRSFAVETPYLVSVVKGTVFSVAIENESTAVSLLEGSVELVADGIEPVLLQPNESARRGANERSISVTKIDVTPPTAPPQASALSPASNMETASPVALTSTDATIAADLNEITAAYHEQRTPPPTVTPVPPPSDPTSPAPDTPGAPNTPGTPTPETPSTPSTPPNEPVPQVPTPPAPDYDDDNVDQDVVCRRKRCDSEDDDDNGRGNDDRDD